MTVLWMLESQKKRTRPHMLVLLLILPRNQSKGSDQSSLGNHCAIRSRSVPCCYRM